MEKVTSRECWEDEKLERLLALRRCAVSQEQTEAGARYWSRQAEHLYLLNHL